MESEKQTCDTHGNVMTRGIKTMTLRYKTVQRIVEMPGWYCPYCSEGLHNKFDMNVSDNAILEMRKELEEAPQN